MTDLWLSVRGVTRGSTCSPSVLGTSDRWPEYQQLRRNGDVFVLTVCDAKGPSLISRSVRKDSCSDVTRSVHADASDCGPSFNKCDQKVSIILWLPLAEALPALGMADVKMNGLRDLAMLMRPGAPGVSTLTMAKLEAAERHTRPLMVVSAAECISFVDLETRSLLRCRMMTATPRSNGLR